MQKKVINTAWHCVVKEVVEANDFLYKYYESETYGLPGGYIDYFGGGKIYKNLSEEG